MADALRFRLTNLRDEGDIEVDETVPPETFPDALHEGTLVGPVGVTGVILPDEGDARFAGEARGRWRMECTRCLAPTENDFTAPFDAEAPIDSGMMDLTDDVRQAIALAEPMKLLCRPDCKGLCPVCRKSRNTGDCGHREETPPPAPSRTRLTPRRHKG